MRHALLFAFLALLIGLTPWIPILYVDHILREARTDLCSTSGVPNCYIIQIGYEKTIAFYGCENGKCFRVKRGHR